MLKKRMEAGELLASALFDLESAIDAAYAAAASYNSALPAARQIANLSAVVGQQAFELGPRILASLSEARAHTVESHHRLQTVRESLGLKERAFGDELPKPDASIRTGDSTPLRVVAAA